MSSRKLIAARDPWGFRPLCMGRRGDAIVFASESCALDSVDAVFERDIEPGEVVWVCDGKVHSIQGPQADKSSLCIFEHIYFARPDSVIDGQSVHSARMLLGAILAKEHPIDADVVVGVPDSGLIAAEGYAKASGIPFADGFIKNRYVGRTFITPDQHSRELAVQLKLNPLRATISGKRVILIDDSVVRGTTAGQIIRLLRNAGATEVHMLSSAPKFVGPCYFGTDIPSKNELFACNHSTEEMRELIGADSLGFLSIDALEAIAPNSKCSFCTGCFSEYYPIPVGGEIE
jgi:amidophosphoribosyltransferase